MAIHDICRFAPTTSGRAHPGTLLAASLSWLDAKSRGATFILRMEDIDPSSVRDQWRSALLQDLEWFGLTWDQLIWQSACRATHEDLLDILASQGRLYSCSCSRSEIQKAGIPSAAGGWVYPGTCRNQVVLDWRSSPENLRVNMAGIHVNLQDESGLDLSQTIDLAMGDPLVRRKDGSVTYQLAVVADDHRSGVNRIVRGRDIASSTATQVALYQLAGWEVPVYRHHLLLLEPRGEKLAKFHGSVGVDQIALHYSPAELKAILAQACGLTNFEGDFSWDQVGHEDRALDYVGGKLILR